MTVSVQDAVIMEPFTVRNGRGRGLTFAHYFMPEPNSGCWLWAGKLESTGYGQFHLNGALFQAHRYAYEQIRGPIPEGLVLDHKCRNRLCVNPDHLEPVTNRENIMRGVGMAPRNAVRTHCKRGHLLEPNYAKASAARGWRECRVCNRAYKRRAYAARKGGIQ